VLPIGERREENGEKNYLHLPPKLKLKEVKEMKES
jgi:hypothetical protein